MNLKFNSDASCFEDAALKQSLLSQLTTSQQLTLEQHLSDCDGCRERLEWIAGETAFWHHATSALDHESTRADRQLEAGEVAAANDSVFMQLNVSLEKMEVEPYAGQDSLHHMFEVASLLDPPNHPEMLGRIDGFNVEQIIGRGGMGVVYRGFDADLHRPVAIKFLAPHLAASGIARQRFAREAQAAAAVVHPSVVAIHSVNPSSVRPYIVMAMISGRSLQKHVEETGPLPVKDIVRIAQQVASGLAAAHEQGLVHRDIKPANILLANDVSRAIITDFGLARAADDASLTQSGWLAGTPHYMSPEQAMGNDVDPRSDLFSLGSVMYFMATGREPFRAEKSYAVLQKIITQQPAAPRSINSDIPQPLEQLIQKLMNTDPNERFESASEAEKTMRNYLAHLQNPRINKAPKVVQSGWRKRNLGQGRALSWKSLPWAMLVLVTSAFFGRAIFIPRPMMPRPSAVKKPVFINRSMPRTITHRNANTNTANHAISHSNFAKAKDTFWPDLQKLKLATDRLERKGWAKQASHGFENLLNLELKQLSNDVSTLEAKLRSNR